MNDSPTERPGLADADLGALARQMVSVVESEPAVHDALGKLASGLGASTGTDAVSMWICSDQGDVLRCAAFWSRDSSLTKRFERASNEAAYAQGEGLPGRAWRSGVPVWSTSADDPRLADLALEAADAGLEPPVALAVPLSGDEHVAGVAELVGALPGADASTERALFVMATEIGQALDRRLRAEAAGAERVRLEVALAAGSMGVWDWDLATNRLRWSETLAAMAGLEPLEFGGRVEDYFELIHPDDREWVMESYLRQFERGEAEHIFIEHRMSLPGPELRWWQIRGRAIRGPDGDLGAMTGVAVDVTDLVERDQHARVRQAQLDLAVSVGAMATWEIDARYGVGRWSDEMMTLMGRDADTGGIDPKRVTGDDALTVLHPDDRWALEEMLESAREGRDYHARYRVVLPDGAVRTLESWGRPLHDSAGELVGMAGVSVDATGSAGTEDDPSR